MVTKVRLTARELWEMGQGDVRRELVNGELIEMTPAGGIHGKITGKVALRLISYVEQRGTGEVVVGDVGFVLGLSQDPERVRAPDVAFVSTGRLPEGGLPQGFLHGAPDLAVEVLSPHDYALDVQQKVRDYLDAGARLVWVIAPGARTVTVYRADGTAALLRETDHLDGEDLLPGLTIPVAEVLG